jgi:hypothetical protein
MSPRRKALPETRDGAIIKALGILVRESHAEAEPDDLDHWRAAALSARQEYDRLCDALRAARASREEAGLRDAIDGLIGRWRTHIEGGASQGWAVCLRQLQEVRALSSSPGSATASDTRCPEHGAPLTGAVTQTGGWYECGCVAPSSPGDGEGTAGTGTDDNGEERVR